ncbi:antibiotic biosynthesis monooxygenase family protein [Pseudonocardia sp.]|jgi:heme-degrading monooxygenase HmoA|uniref:antibiotic biosynthesis monooxygenase family protein n=1 Tax=Pseudonocardia sp. TaxID=60912 RepID=UPI003D1008A1
MFAVMFEAHPKPHRRDTYLELVTLLDDDLRATPGFLAHDRYRSLVRPGWVLSLSTWQDEKALVRWRTHPRHQLAQTTGRDEIFVDYTVRTGELTRDTSLPGGGVLAGQRFDGTAAGAGNTAVLVGVPGVRHASTRDAGELAAHLGLDLDADGLTSWDVYEAVEAPGHVLLRTVWHDPAAAVTFESTAAFPGDPRVRRLRIIRWYSMYNREEAPQYYPVDPA